MAEKGRTQPVAEAEFGTAIAHKKIKEMRKKMNMLEKKHIFASLFPIRKK